MVENRWQNYQDPHEDGPVPGGLPLEKMFFQSIKLQSYLAYI